jgi:hypothetical protein
MQTSFMHPPFGFALFYLRSVAPAKDYIDRISGKRTAKVTIGQIYWGSVPFVLIQVLMVALVIAVPDIVGGGMVKKAAVDTDTMQIQVPDAAVGAGAQGQNDMENALERALGEDAEAAPLIGGQEEQDQPKDEADRADADKGAAAASSGGR